MKGKRSPVRTRKTAVKKVGDAASAKKRASTGKHSAAKVKVGLVKIRKPRTTPISPLALRDAKSKLRKQVRARIDALRGKAAKSKLICEFIARHPAWERATTVAIFAPLPIEPDVELLWPMAPGKIYCYPLMRVDGLDFIKVTSPDSLVVGQWGLREPAMNPSRIIPPAEIDFILVPGYAFCADGRRLGRGGGFYDRLLATPKMRAWCMAVGFHCQILEDIPTEPHDRRVHGIVTEKGFV